MSTGAVLVDCLTLWLLNLVLADVDIEAETDRLEAALSVIAGPVVLVSNEVGFGIVPDNALGRRFRDAQERLNQRIAACADRVVLMVVGLPLVVKGDETIRPKYFRCSAPILRESSALSGVGPHGPPGTVPAPCRPIPRSCTTGLVRVAHRRGPRYRRTG
jgi:hypothetical protein